MNEIERAEARQYLKVQEQLKNPVIKKACELSKNKSKEESKRKEILESWGKYGCYVPPESQQQINKVQKTAEQKRMEGILENYM